MRSENFWDVGFSQGHNIFLQKTLKKSLLLQEKFSRPVLRIKFLISDLIGYILRELKNFIMVKNSKTWLLKSTTFFAKIRSGRWSKKASSKRVSPLNTGKLSRLQLRIGKVVFELSQKVSKKWPKFQNFDLFEGHNFFLKEIGCSYIRSLVSKQPLESIKPMILDIAG